MNTTNYIHYELGNEKDYIRVINEVRSLQKDYAVTTERMRSLAAALVQEDWRLADDLNGIATKTETEFIDLNLVYRKLVLSLGDFRIKND